MYSKCRVLTFLSSIAVIVFVVTDFPTSSLKFEPRPKILKEDTGPRAK